MDGKRNEVIFGVTTRFFIGLYTYDPRKHSDRLNYRCVIGFAELGEAEDWFMDIIKNAGDGTYGDVDRQFSCNRLYQYKSKRIYTVVWNKQFVLFTETERLNEVLTGLNVDMSDCRYRYNLEYAEAQNKVFHKAQDTGYDAIYAKRNPKMNVLYRLMIKPYTFL